MSLPCQWCLREVAQLGRVLVSGARGRRFDSCLPDIIYDKKNTNPKQTNK